ncbi:expressed unknown protein (Partial), partial [Seminavis robusta]|eukprot:Sro2319_g323100.1 n/a (119) ;mRNA; r:2-358
MEKDMKKKKTQSHDGSGQQQQQQNRNSFDAIDRNVGAKKGEQEKKEIVELVVGSQGPTTFPSSSQPNHAPPPALVHDVISGIQPLPTESPPALNRAQRASEAKPGAYAVAGIRPMFHRP